MRLICVGSAAEGSRSIHRVAEVKVASVPSSMPKRVR